MKRLVITEQRLGESISMFIIETSDGKRATAPTVYGALDKLVKLVPVSSEGESQFRGIKVIFDGIDDNEQVVGNIHKGVQS